MDADNAISWDNSLYGGGGVREASGTIWTMTGRGRPGTGVQHLLMLLLLAAAVLEGCTGWDAARKSVDAFRQGSLPSDGLTVVVIRRGAGGA
jgi:hypothetical protein